MGLAVMKRSSSSTSVLVGQISVMIHDISNAARACFDAEVERSFCMSAPIVDGVILRCEGGTTGAEDQ